MSTPDRPNMQNWRIERPLRRALRPVVFAVVAVTLLCLIAHVAFVVEAMLMLDVALPGRSGQTIAGLLAMAAGTLALLLGGLILRQRLLRQAGRMIAFRAAPITAAHRFGSDPQQQAAAADGRDMDMVRTALTGGSVAALADAALLPLYIVVMVLLGWPMAVALLIGAGVGVALLYFGRGALDRNVAAAERASADRDELLRTNTTSRQLIRQLGIFHPMRAREEYAELVALGPIDALDRAVDRTRLAIAALITVVTVAVGALTVWRATHDLAGFGTVAAALILTGFALWPLREIAARQVDLLRGRSAWRRLSEALEVTPAQDDVLPLPAPRETLNAEAIAIAAPGERRVVLQGETFAMAAGDVTVVVGPSDSGKSMLLRALAGLAPNSIGNVRLDGATLAQFGEAGRARHIGYMGQDCQLLPGTISQIIAGFSDAIDPEAIVRAAQTTGAHDLIVRLPQGYDTLVGGPDCSLPQSTRQRINLTSAFFGDPFLLLLDTPDSFQDRQGQAALGGALRAASARGAIVVIVGEATAVIDAANLAMVLRKGGIADFGPKEQVRERMQAREQIKNQPKPDVVAPAAPAE